MKISTHYPNIYNIIVDYNPKRKRKILIAFDDMLAHISTNKKFQFIVKEILIQKDFMNIYKEYTRRLYSFWLLILHYTVIILWVSEKIF